MKSLILRLCSLPVQIMRVLVTSQDHNFFPHSGGAALRVVSRTPSRSKCYGEEMLSQISAPSAPSDSELVNFHRLFVYSIFPLTYHKGRH